MNQDRLEAIVTLTALIARAHENLPAHVVSRNVLKLGKLASSLHKRYEAACNYEWANTDKYEEHTARLEQKAAALGVELEVKVDHQRDPRGWPLVITVGDKEERLG